MTGRVGRNQNTCEVCYGPLGDDVVCGFCARHDAGGNE